MAEPTIIKNALKVIEADCIKIAEASRYLPMNDRYLRLLIEKGKLKNFHCPCGHSILLLRKEVYQLKKEREEKKARAAINKEKRQRQIKMAQEKKKRKHKS